MRPMKNIKQAVLERAYVALHERQNQVGLILTAILARSGGEFTLTREEIDASAGKDVSWEMKPEGVTVWVGKPNAKQNGSGA